MKAGTTMGNPELTALWVVAPKKAAAQVRAAMKGQTAEAAARALGVGRTTLFRWLKRPEMKA